MKKLQKVLNLARTIRSGIYEAIIPARNLIFSYTTKIRRRKSIRKIFLKKLEPLRQDFQTIFATISVLGKMQIRLSLNFPFFPTPPVRIFRTALQFPEISIFQLTIDHAFNLGPLKITVRLQFQYGGVGLFRLVRYIF